MEYFDNILCVTYKELLDIMPKGTLNSQLSREKLDVVSRGGGVKIIRLCMPIPPFPKSINDVGFFSKENLNSK